MKSRILKSSIAVAAFALVWGAALAAEEIQEVQVQANRIVNTKVVGRSPSGVPITEISVTYRVSLGDLNLATHSGATAAEQRLSDAALAACRQIARQYPDSTPSDRQCAKEASDRAMAKLHELVAAAESAPGRG